MSVHAKWIVQYTFSKLVLALSSTDKYIGDCRRKIFKIQCKNVESQSFYQHTTSFTIRFLPKVFTDLRFHRALRHSPDCDSSELARSFHTIVLLWEFDLLLSVEELRFVFVA